MPSIPLLSNGSGFFLRRWPTTDVVLGEDVTETPDWDVQLAGGDGSNAPKTFLPAAIVLNIEFIVTT